MEITSLSPNVDRQHPTLFPLPSPLSHAHKETHPPTPTLTHTRRSEGQWLLYSNQLQAVADKALQASHAKSTFLAVSMCGGQLPFSLSLSLSLFPIYVCDSVCLRVNCVSFAPSPEMISELEPMEMISKAC